MIFVGEGTFRREDKSNLSIDARDDTDNRKLVN